ncbi:putative reverse transcriptase domain-containing protein [Tanacetum coccineum]
MAALVISISSDVSVKSVGSSFPRVILIGSISVDVLVVPEVGAAVVASPAGVLDLDAHSSLEVDPSESSPPPVSVAPMVSPFLCSEDSESDTEIPKRYVSPTPHEAMLTRWRSRVVLRSSSPTTSILEILTVPILPAPSSEFPLAPDIPIGQLYSTYPGRPCRALTARKSVRPLPSHRLALRYTSRYLDHSTSGSLSHSSSDHSSSRHSISGHSLSGHTPPNTTDADSSTPLRFVHPSLARTPRCSEAYLRWRFTPLSTMYPPTTSESLAGDSSSESSAGPSRKRCRSLVATVTSYIHATRALVPSCADLLPPRKRIEDIEMGQRELESRSLIVGRERASLLDQVASLERSNVRLRGTMMMERVRANRFRRCMRFIESELRQIFRFRYYDRMRFRRLETFAVRHLVEEALAAYEATRAANALEAESQSQNGNVLRIENGAKTGIIRLDLIKFNYYSKPRRSIENAIVVPAVLADEFELKTELLDFVSNNSFFDLENDDPHSHIRRFYQITRTLKLNQVPDDVVKLILFPFSLKGAAETWLENEPPNSLTSWDDLVSKFLNRFFPHSKTRELRKEITNFQQVFGETFTEAWERFKDLLRKCPHHVFSLLHQIDFFYNGLSQSDQDFLNTTAGGNLMSRNTHEALTIIENKAKVRTCRNKPQVSSSGGISNQNDDITALTTGYKLFIFACKEAYYRNKKPQIHINANSNGNNWIDSFHARQIIRCATVKHRKYYRVDPLRAHTCPTSGNSTIVRHQNHKEDLEPNPHHPPIPCQSQLQKEKFHALENLTECADHFVYRIDIVDSWCDTFPIENNSVSGNPTPSSDSMVESLSPIPTPFEDSDSLLEENDTLLSHIDDFFPEYETFCFDIKEKSSGSTTNHSDYSLSD